jgi:hypothetical protein
MENNIHFVIKLVKGNDWKHERHAWHIPLLKIPGIKIKEVKNENTTIDQSTYQVNYKKQLLLGSGVQHFDYLLVQLYFTFRLSTWMNVIITGTAGLTGMIILFVLPVITPPQVTAKQTPTGDSIVKNLSEKKKDTATVPIVSPQPGISSHITKSTPKTNITISNNPNQREVIVIIGSIPDSAGSTGKPVAEDFGTTQDVTEILGRKQCKTISSYFSSAIFQNGIFQQLIGTNFSRVSLDSLRSTADEICVATVWRNVRPTVSQKDMYVGEIHIRLKFISLTTGSVTQQYDQKLTSSAAFRKEKALAQANEKLKNYLNENL